jgi:hypothetical protein
MAGRDRCPSHPGSEIAAADDHSSLATPLPVARRLAVLAADDRPENENGIVTIVRRMKLLARIVKQVFKC